MQAQYPLNKVFSNLTPILQNEAPFKQNWTDGSFYLEAVQQTPILVVGAGGLGCELVKNLALSGFRQIHLVDMDTVDFTNLNRQFMFRQKDIGKYKADVIAQFVKKRCPGVKITTYKKKVQEIPYNQYHKFPIIIGGLDNVEARKYLNHIAFLLNENSQQTVCYYIDGATEGFQGQALLVDPFKSSCYECSLLGGLAQKPKYNICTLANTPRIPEHCIQYVIDVQWENQRKDIVRDNDNLQHLKWIFEKASERAKKFNIEGVTQMLTLGVIKNVIPAIASTNALIAAVCTNQVFKILSGCNPSFNNYMLFKGGTSIGMQTYAAGRLQTCRSCHMRQNRLQKVSIKVKRNSSFQFILNEVKKHHEYINKPYVNYKGQIFLNPLDNERYPTKIKATLQELIDSNILKQFNPIVVYLTDLCLKDQLRVDIILAENDEQTVV